MKNQTWLSEAISCNTVTRTTSVVPVYGFGMGDVRPMTLNHVVLTSTDKRHESAAQAAVWGPQPWSPPVI